MEGRTAETACVFRTSACYIRGHFQRSREIGTRHHILKKKKKKRRKGINTNTRGNGERARRVRSNVIRVGRRKKTQTIAHANLYRTADFKRKRGRIVISFSLF